MTPVDALAAAAALHLGFQLVVTAVVYPALAEVPHDDWQRAHDAHSRRITLVVGLVYGLLAAACLWVLVSGSTHLAALISVAGAVISALATAFVAAPVHGELGRAGRNGHLMSRLRSADRVRLCGAVVCALFALLA
ncbi:hypothetical protein CH296_09330 [Rhodococcus sp. 14-2496-1d]|uniref:hypothetical protein n=1 Tax=Rhodococcus sp. 14-2496-1d TaxID=2023146 RepID=UPI000B9AC75C|nr:hypothetical protein [Rhodococcus sp. 14-2496-1d]OZF34841.1 hypothetical protein CH296_09330 [Rhodococcus sp. 14-2496-1d]